MRRLVAPQGWKASQNILFIYARNAARFVLAGSFCVCFGIVGQIKMLTNKEEERKNSLELVSVSISINFTDYRAT
jgi:predicted nucleic acid-binding Zn finger protein